jgi:outer membrane protein TolC
VGEVTQIDDAAGTVAVSLEQTVLDLARQEGARASQKAELAARRAEQADELAFRRLEAARAYLEVLDIRAGLEAARSSQASVSEQLARVRRLVEEGRVLRSEQLRLEVELRRLGQEISSLERGLAVARLELARQAGRGAEDTAAVTTRPVAVDRGALAGWLAAVPRSVTDRGDIEALSHRISRLEAERRAVGQSALPRITVGIAGVRQLDSSLEPDEWIEGSLVVEWAPFAGATRAARREALAERRAALEARYRAAADGGAVAAQRLRTAVRDALERISVAEQTVAQEMQVLEETTRQYRQGAISVSEYVDAESRLQQARVERRRAEISAAQAAFRLTYVTGLGLQSVMEIWLTHP